ncbi:hypothetical protein B2J93_3735 [Marssonina coronariae]|uniref:Uncharacterized protein n=1 Tax=Diplocarpon coronariae TaxID=2795749 RepID=A0A218YXZ9_9HELO|nr:hypothetical protein B2J93_3735 [Marssonina coronariae]
MSASILTPPQGQSLEEAFERYAGSMNLQMPLVSFPMHKELKEHVDALTSRLQSARKKWPTPIANGRWEGLKSYLCVLYRVKIWNEDQNKLWRVKELLVRISKIGDADHSALPPVAVAMARKLLYTKYPPVSVGSRAPPLSSPSPQTHQAVLGSQMSDQTPQDTPILSSHPSTKHAKNQISSGLTGQNRNGVDRVAARTVQAEQQDTIMGTVAQATTTNQIVSSCTVIPRLPLLAQPINEIEMDSPADITTQDTASRMDVSMSGNPSTDTDEVRTLREEIRALSENNMRLSGWCVGWEHKCKRFEFFVGSLEGLEHKMAGEGRAAATQLSGDFESLKDQYRQAQGHIQALEEQLKSTITVDGSTYKDLYLASQQRIKNLEQSVKAGFSDDGTSFKQLFDESVDINTSLQRIINGTIASDVSTYKDLYFESADKVKDLQQQVKAGFSDEGTSFQQLFEESMKSKKSIEGALKTMKSDLEVSRDEIRKQKESVLTLERAIESTKNLKIEESEIYHRDVKNRIKFLEEKIAFYEKEKSASISRVRSCTPKANRNADLVAQLERAKNQNILHEITIRILKRKAAENYNKYKNCIAYLSKPAMTQVGSEEKTSPKPTNNPTTPRRTPFARSENGTLGNEHIRRKELIVLENLPGSWNEDHVDETPAWVTSSAQYISSVAKN